MSQMKIILDTTDGNTVSVDVRPEETYRMLKDRIQVESGIELEISQIFYDGKQVEEDQNVYESFLGVHPENDEEEKPNIVCVVEGCPSSKLTDPKKAIFKFPLESDRYSTWLLACNRHDLLGRIPVSLNLDCGVCADHFPDSCFISGSFKKRLRKNAVPVLEERHNFSILAQEMILPAVKLEDVALNDCSNSNSTARFEIQDTVDTLPLMASANDGEHILTKDGSTSENASNQDEVDEEDLQEDELEELEDEEEDEEDDSDIMIKNGSSQEHPGLICRLCAQTVDTAYFLFSEEGRGEKLFDKINTSLPISIHCNDLLPKQICGQCLSTLNICYDFAMAAVKAEGKLQKMVPRFRCQDDVQVNKQSLLNDNNLSEDGNTDNGGKKDNNDSQCFNCPLCCAGQMESRDDVNIEEIEGRDSKDDEDVVQDFLADSVLWEEGEDFLVSDHNYQDDVSNESEDNEECHPCLICGANFVSLAHLFEHSERHEATEGFPCGHCGLVFDLKETLGAHFDIVIHSVFEDRYKCRDCGKLFTSEERAEFHHDTAHNNSGVSSLSCLECGQIFKQETNLWDHMQILHRGQKPFSCPKCDKVFQIRTHLTAHMCIHDMQRSFQCEMCSETFLDRSSLAAHEASHTDLKMFQCEQCGRCFTRKFLLTAHMRTHVDKKPRVYTCRVCGEDGFESLPKLLVHRRNNHQDVMLPLGSKKDKIHKCEQCNKAFTGRVALKHHAMSHAGELPHVCEFCNKGFTQKRSLLLHRRIHTGEKPYECGECGKRFVQSAHLYSHLRLHTGEKPYPCSECGATFRLKDVRDSHQRKHTGERPFKCKDCDKSFRTSHSYYQHTWIHTGRKPYPCNYCGKAFRRSNGLKVHIRIHTGEKPHKCDICGRGFAQKQDMKKHKNLHTLGRL